MKIVVQVLLALSISFNVFATVMRPNQQWVETVVKENPGISHVYFTSGKIMIALISFNDGTSQFYEITRDEKVTTIFQVTERFTNSDLSKVTDRAKYFVMVAEHGRSRMQPGLNLTDGAITAGISTPVGFALVPFALVLDTLTAPVQFGIWAGKHDRRVLENWILRSKVEAQKSYVELNDTQYSQVKWALGQAHPIRK